MSDVEIMIGELVTPHEAAELLGYSTRQVYRFIKRSQLESLALWGKRFILKRELDRFQTEITEGR